MSGFLRRARDEVRPLGAFVSADVFGSAAWNDGDNGVGHDMDALAGSVDSRLDPDDRVSIVLAKRRGG